MANKMAMTRGSMREYEGHEVSAFAVGEHAPAGVGELEHRLRVSSVYIDVGCR
jgi:hypothetical protein